MATAVLPFATVVTGAGPDLLRPLVDDFLRDACADWSATLDGRALDTPFEAHSRSLYEDRALSSVGPGAPVRPIAPSAWTLWAAPPRQVDVEIRCHQRPSGHALVVGVVACRQVDAQRWKARLYAVAPGHALMASLVTHLLSVYPPQPAPPSARAEPPPRVPRSGALLEARPDWPVRVQLAAQYESLRALGYPPEQAAMQCRMGGTECSAKGLQRWAARARALGLLPPVDI